MHGRNPAVVHLTLHLENGQRQKDSFAEIPLYSEVPMYHTWNASRKSFERRKRGEPVDGQPVIFKQTTIGRLYTVHPNQDECFFLCML
ncbi:unnamed protein product, partial [Onchocerca ochengi]